MVYINKMQYSDAAKFAPYPGAGLTKVGAGSYDRVFNKKINQKQ